MTVTPEIQSPFDRSNDPLRAPPSSLDAIFRPRNVAVIGATDKEGSVGRTLLWNLISHPFGGAVFPVNPKRRSVLGVKAYPTLTAVPDQVDLAVVVTPAPSVPAIMRECVEKRVKGAIVISAGFKEAGPEGVALEREVKQQVALGGMRLIGPNCLGVMSPLTGLNATFAAGMARPGNVAFMSQSGALCTAVLDWSMRENVGFSAFASLGSMLDVSWGDLIEYLGRDPSTHSIIIYMETIGDARAFLSAAREVAPSKPIIVIKPGRTEAGARAAASHTGSLTGSDEVLDAAFRRCGALRVNDIAELFYMAEVLSKQPRPAGPRLCIVTNAGGPGVLATDALLLAGGKLASLSPETQQALDGVLPPHWSHGNPIDVLGDASPERYAQALEIAARDPGSDGLLVVLTPQAMTDPTRTAEALRPYAHLPGKPVLASWMGGPGCAGGRGDPEQDQHPDVRLPRHRRQGVPAHVALHRQPAGAVRDAGAARWRPAERGPGGGGGHHPAGAGRGAHVAVRGRVQAGAGGLRHPHRAHPGGDQRGGGGGGRPAAGLPGGAEAAFLHHHPQDRRRAG